MKKFLALFLAFTMLLSLAACASSTTDETTQTGDSTSESAPVEDVHITYLGAGSAEIEPDSWAENYVNEHVDGVDFEMVKADNNNFEQVDLMLASGEMPDAMWVLHKTAEDVYSQGVSREIPREMIEQYAPNYTALLNSDPYGWELMQSPDTEGSYIGLTGYTGGVSDSLMFVSLYRYDWLEQLGIEPNGEVIPLDDSGKRFMATEPFTQDDFTEIMEKFSTMDPDQNGENDTYGMTAGFDESFSWNSVLSMFNIQGTISDGGYNNLGGFIESDGKAISPFVSDEYKEFLTYMQSMYNNKYLDQEFATLDRNQAHEKFSDGKAGFITYLFSWVNPNLAALDSRPSQAVLTRNEDAKILIAPPNVANDGSGGSVPYSYINYNYKFVVNENVTDEELAKILEVFDYIHFNEEAQIALRYGEEGVHFNWEGEPLLSSPVPIGEESYSGGVYGLNALNTYIRSTELGQLAYADSTRMLAEYVSGDWLEYAFAPYKVSVGTNDALVDARDKYAANLKTISLEYFSNAISGNSNVEGDWDAYIENLNGAGYIEFEEAIQGCPNYKDIAPEILFE